ncbi:MAG: DUF4157 domain-containing protein [Cyanobacteria bacterium P01_D01_bin.14]
MTREAAVQAQLTPTTHPASQGSILQRKCTSCGQHKTGGGTCAKCQASVGVKGPALLPVIQTQLTIGQPDDKYEKEADRVAEQVMRMPTPEAATTVETQFQSPKVQRMCTNCEEEKLQAKGTPGNTPEVTPAIASHVQSLQGGGQPLPTSTRSFFEPRFGHDFSHVRVHNDTQSTTALNAHAYTVGRHIVFNTGQYSPQTIAGKHLLAHELTHVLQQTSPALTQKIDQQNIQRSIAEADLPTTPVEEIMADEDYFENGITNIEFYSAELAILHYSDGTSIRLGLVPGYIESPFEAVDYRTRRSGHLTISPQAPSLGTGSIDFIPGGRNLQTPPGLTFGDLPRIFEAVGRTIRFTIHRPSGRIVPTEVNDISAPRLSEGLRRAEAEFIRRFDEMSEGAIEVLETLEWVIILASIAGSLAAAAARGLASRGAVAGAAEVASRAQGTLARFFTRLLGRSSAEAITVEGVQFSGVRVFLRSGEFIVQRFSIQNISRIPGRGRLVHGAFEQAAVQAARQAGARTAQVAVETVVNPTWRAYLESIGYSKQLIESASGIQAVWVRVFTL